MSEQTPRLKRTEPPGLTLEQISITWSGKSGDLTIAGQDLAALLLALEEQHASGTNWGYQFSPDVIAGDLKGVAQILRTGIAAADSQPLGPEALDLLAERVESAAARVVVGEQNPGEVVRGFRVHVRAQDSEQPQAA